MKQNGLSYQGAKSKKVKIFFGNVCIDVMLVFLKDEYLVCFEVQRDELWGKRIENWRVASTTAVVVVVVKILKLYSRPINLRNPASN